MKIKTAFYRIIVWCWKINPLKRETAFLVRYFDLPVEKLHRDLRFNGKFSVSFENRQVSLFSYYSTIENEIFWKGIENGWEKVSLKCWLQLCKRANVIMDVGANTGIYALLAKKINSAASVYCYEPSVLAFEKLQKNISLNKLDIHAYPVALSDRKGRATFYDFDSPHQYSASLNAAFAAHEPNRASYEVVTQTLQSFIEENQLLPIDLMKIDVESHEPEVLEGMGSYLEKYKPVLLIEILTDEAAKRIESLLPEAVYHFYNIDEVHQPFEVSHLCKSDTLNFLLVPSDKLTWMNTIMK